jgi:hypothetical protein
MSPKKGALFPRLPGHAFFVQELGWSNYTLCAIIQTNKTRKQNEEFSIFTGTAFD